MIPGEFVPYGIGNSESPPFKTYTYKTVTKQPKSKDGNYPANYTGVYSGKSREWSDKLQMDVYLPYTNATKYEE